MKHIKNKLDSIENIFAEAIPILYKRDMLIKFLNAKKQVSEDGEKVTFVASTETPDRYGDIISVRGWKLDSYKRNPIILLNHDSSALPIAKGNVHIKNNQLLVDVEFDMDDPQAASVARKVKKGFINAVSVGFQPLEAVARKDFKQDNPLYSRRGQFFKAAELLEVSIVTIPANSEATMLGKNQGLNEAYIRSIVQSELEAAEQKHILNVEETDDTIIITYAKPDLKEEEEEEEEVEELDLDEDEDTEEMAYGEDDDEDSKEEKSYLNEISKYLATLL